MSESQWRSDPDSEDLADAPFIDDMERAESAWLLAREGDSGAAAPSRALARDHAELEDLLSDLSPGPPDEGWQDEVLKRTSAAVTSRPRRSRRAPWWIVGGGLVAAAAVAVVVLRPRPIPRADELEIAIRRGNPARGDSREAAIGDHLIIRARSLGTGDFRVYRADGTLVARCPDGPSCAISAGGEHSLDVRLDAPIQYHVVLVIGMTGHLPGGTMNAYLDAARAANARIVTYPPIDVR